MLRILRVIQSSFFYADIAHRLMELALRPRRDATPAEDLPDLFRAAAFDDDREGEPPRGDRGLVGTDPTHTTTQALSPSCLVHLWPAKGHFLGQAEICLVRHRPNKTSIPET